MVSVSRTEAKNEEVPNKSHCWLESKATVMGHHRECAVTMSHDTSTNHKRCFSMGTEKSRDIRNFQTWKSK
jgi:hypothetical protein